MAVEPRDRSHDRRARFVLPLLAGAALVLEGCMQCGRDEGSDPGVEPSSLAPARDIQPTTSNPPARAGSFLVVGDWGWDKDIHGNVQTVGCQAAIAEAMAAKQAELGDVKFVVNVGDSFYPGGVANASDPQWQEKWRDVYSPELRGIPWYSVYGNHDLHKDRCTCSSDEMECGQVTADTSDLGHFYMPATSYHVQHPDLGLEVIALDHNYLWANYTCHYTLCPEKCHGILKARMEAAFELFYERIAESEAANLVVFSHYPTDYFWAYPEFLQALSNDTRHSIQVFGGHRHNVDQRSVTSIEPNTAWLVGGGGGWGCEGYGNEQGFVVGEIDSNGTVSTYPVLVDFEVCCPR